MVLMPIDLCPIFGFCSSSLIWHVPVNSNYALGKAFKIHIAIGLNVNANKIQIALLSAVLISFYFFIFYIGVYTVCYQGLGRGERKWLAFWESESRSIHLSAERRSRYCAHSASLQPRVHGLTRRGYSSRRGAILLTGMTDSWTLE